MMLSVPGNSSEMVWIFPSRFLLSGWGPLGFALEVSPLPLATSNCRPSGVTRTEVGYQPTGINPSERLLPITLTSKTATLLLQALATNNRVSSGDNATLFGVEPGGALGESEAYNVSTALPVSVSNTVTVFRFAL